MKALKEILVGLPIILKNIKVQEKDLDAVLCAVPWVFKKEIPSFIKDVRDDFIRELESYDVCAVHVKLILANH